MSSRSALSFSKRRRMNSEKPLEPNIEEGTSPLPDTTAALGEAAPTSPASATLKSGQSTTEIETAKPPRRGLPPARRRRTSMEMIPSDSDEPPAAAKKLRHEERSRQMLACPFYKRHPTQYRLCRRFLLTKISYVKQHIARQHKMPLHCQLCLEQFASSGDLQRHVQARTCEVRPYVPPDGVTETQLLALGRRVDQKKSVDDQWFDIYGILFPDAPRPSSVYLDIGLSPDLDEFKEFLQSSGPEFLARYVERATNSPSAPGEDSTVQDALSTGLQDIYDGWYRQRSRDPEASRDTSTSIPSAPTTPVLEGDVFPPVTSLIGTEAGSVTSSTGQLLHHTTAFASGGAPSSTRGPPSLSGIPATRRRQDGQRQEGPLKGMETRKRPPSETEGADTASHTRPIPKQPKEKDVQPSR